MAVQPAKTSEYFKTFQVRFTNCATLINIIMKILWYLQTSLQKNVNNEMEK